MTISSTLKQHNAKRHTNAVTATCTSSLGRPEQPAFIDNRQLRH